MCPLSPSRDLNQADGIAHALSHRQRSRTLDQLVRFGDVTADSRTECFDYACDAVAWKATGKQAPNVGTQALDRIDVCFHAGIAVVLSAHDANPFRRRKLREHVALMRSARAWAVLLVAS